MFGPMRSPESAGGSGVDRGGSIERNILELRPASVLVNSVSREQLEKLFRTVRAPFPNDFIAEIHDLLVAGMLPDVENIASQIDIDSMGSLESYTHWEVTCGRMREALECRITPDETEPDLRQLTFCLRSEQGSGRVSLQIEFDENALAAEGVVPDRWGVFERMLTVMGLTGPGPHVTIPEGASSFAPNKTVSMHFAGVEPPPAPALYDPHLPLRSDLAIDVLCADDHLELPQIAYRLCTRILKGGEMPLAVIETPNGLEEGWWRIKEAGRASEIRTLSFLHHDGILLPVSRTATLKTLTEDLQQLQKLRSDIHARGPDESLAAPVGMLLRGVIPEEASTIMGLLGFSLPIQLSTHLHDVLSQGVPFVPGLITSSNCSQSNLSCRLGEIVVQSDPDGFDALQFFKFSKPGAPKVMLWAGGPDDDDGAAQSHSRGDAAGLCLYASWPIEQRRATPAESIYRWGLVNSANAALGCPPLPATVKMFFAPKAEEPPTSGRVEVFTFRMPPEL